MKNFNLALAILVFGFGITASAQSVPPGFAIKFGDGTFREYRVETIDDNRLSANVSDRGGNQWELTVKPKGQNIAEVWFPYEADAQPLGVSASDDIVYYPLLTGFTYRNSIANNNEWLSDNRRPMNEPCYPGNCFSPLEILADQNSARLVAAVNWPPKSVTPVWSRSRLALRYNERITAGETAVYRALIEQILPSPTRGEKPWQLAADSYKKWLKEKMTAAGLYPLPYPDWLKRSNGWLQIILSEVEEFDANFIETKWQRWRTFFPWLQIWGQMSNYGGPIHLPTNPGTGCCLMKQEIDPRYLPGLADLARRITQAGGQVGYYSRPAVDAAGNMITKWNGGGIAEITANIK